MSEVITRFKEKKKIGCLVAIRASESLDRRVVLKQGDYRTGRYGTQYDCEVVSPFMDLSTEDLWKANSLLNLEINDIYSMMWDSCVPLAKQRIGSPVNSHASDGVKLYKALNPTTYGKMVGRLDTIDFTASYGGVFNNGFKYIKLDQPRPFLFGIVTDPALIEAINYVGLDYQVKGIDSIDSDEAKEIYNSATRKVSSGENIFLMNVQKCFIRELAAQKAEENGDLEKAKYFRDNLPKPKYWYDYMLQLCNGAEPMYQKSWKPKVETSMKHWKTTGSAVNESTIIALRVLGYRQNKSFGCDEIDYQEFVDWSINGYTDITRKPVLRMFRYNQDCPENIARSYLYSMVEHWDDGGREEFESNAYLNDMIFNGLQDKIVNGKVPALINFSTCVRAKELHDCIVSGTQYIGTMWENEDSDSEQDVIVNKTETPIKIRFRDCGSGKSFDECSDVEKENRIKATLCNIAYNLFHDQVRESASWKRVVIAMLRNDAHFTYLGFGQSSEERLIRANAEATFAENEKERQEKMAKFEKAKAALEKQIQKEKAV